MGSGAVKYTYRHTLRACYAGFITQAIVNNLAPLLFIVFQDRFGISDEMLGRLILVNFGTQIVSDVLSMRYADRIGYRRMMVAAHAFCAAGLVCLGLLPQLLPSPYLGLTAAAVLYAVGGGMIEVLVSPIVNALPGDAKASTMSLLHSFYCWGQMGVVIVTTLLLRAVGQGLWFLLPVAWAVLPVCNLFLFRKVPLAQAEAPQESMKLTPLLARKAFLLALVLMLCAGSSELVMSQWSSLFAQKGLLIPKVLGDLLGPCLFAAFMGAGRVAYGVFGHRVDLRRAMAASAALCVICYAAAVFASMPALALAGCALCGLSVSLMWPGTLSLTAEACPGGGTMMFGALAVFGDLGASVGPWLAGWVSDLAQKNGKLLSFGSSLGLNAGQLGLKAGLFAGMIFPILLLAGVMMLKKNKNMEAREL